MLTTGIFMLRATVDASDLPEPGIPTNAMSFIERSNLAGIL
jgi:hypothetical protein